MQSRRKGTFKIIHIKRVVAADPGPPARFLVLQYHRGGPVRLNLSVRLRVSPIEQTSRHIQACYDAVAQEYAERFAGELAHKPLDRELLARFASEVRGRGEVYDLGCGPGQTTAFLHACGVRVRGLDLSPELLREARQRHPGIEFEPGDMLALPLADASLAGVIAFYSAAADRPGD
jgi:SAM-dependent methyltransferase